MAEQTEQVKVTESKDGSVRVQQPKGKRHHGVTVLLDSDDIVREQVGGFKNFLQEYAVVGLAIGFIVGQQANKVAGALVSTFVDPVVKTWFGQNLSDRKAYILHHNGAGVALPWGSLVYALIEFFVVLIVIYLVIKLFCLDKFGKKQ